MNAVEVVESLVKVGTAMKGAWTNAKSLDANMDWEKFIRSNDFAKAYEQVTPILNGLTQADVTRALERVRAKEAAVLNGQSPIQLSTEKLAQYDALLDVENQLMRKFAANASKSTAWVSWVVDDMLPVMIKVAKVVIPILL